MAIAADDDIGVVLALAARLAHVAQLAPLSAICPGVGEIDDAEGVVANVELHVGVLFVGRFSLACGAQRVDS